jgi:predicted enzyme related to lactoylglutathione lyase
MATIPTGRFVWFEYSSKDAAKAQAFFGELFGWKTKQIVAEQAPYTMIEIGGTTIGGYWPPPPEGASQQAQWISHLQVHSADDSARKVESLGGKVHMPPMKVGDFGTFAVVADPTGAVFSLWQPEKHEGNPEFPGKAGHWVWNELHTPDPEKATAFYKALGGFEEESMDMGEMGTYHLLNKDGAGRAGVMKAMTPGVAGQWLPYVQVDDADGIADRATKLGGHVKVGPSDIPHVGRFAILVDPQGAELGILKPSPR